MTENNIPSHWQVKKLGEVCEIKSGKNQSKVINPNGQYPIYGSSGIFGYADDYICDEGTTIIGRKGTINSPIYVTTKFWNVDTAFGLCPKNGLASKFLYYFCLGFNFFKLDKSTTIPSLAKSDLLTIDIPIPPLPEQHAIVSKIEELLSDLDNGVQQLRTAAQQLKVYRQSLLKAAFEGRLTNKEVKDGELPEGWKWVKNKELLKYVTSGSRDWKQFYSSKGSRFVRTQDINSNKLDIANAAFVDLPEKVEGKRSLIEFGDLLMTITGANVGKIAVVDFQIEEAYVSQSVALMKYKDKQITKYLWYYFQAQGFGKSFIDKSVYGVGRPVLSLENMREVDILICPIEDQKEIIEILESKLTVCDKIEETIARGLQQAETLRQSILKKAFEGRLV